MDAAITFSLTTTSCPQKANKSCTSVVFLYSNKCCNNQTTKDAVNTFHRPVLLDSTSSISHAPLLSVQTTKETAMEAAITFSLTTTSCPHKTNKSCTSVQITKNAAMEAVIRFSLTTTSCQHKVNKSCISLVFLDNKGCCNGRCDKIFIDHYFLSAQGQ